jgi:D-glycero-alpha-D-manno-heptose-7-phosphate kinase
MKVRATTANRIDLAGGTLDIHPLYVFEGEAVTVNLGIDITSRVDIETRGDSKILLRSIDFGQSVEAANLESLELGKELDLLARAVKFMQPRTGLEVVTENLAPKGSGLGASSALWMALLAALSTVNDEPVDREKIIDWGANLEAQNIGIPTGKQDYYGAVYGGLSAITFGVKGAKHEHVEVGSEFLSTLENRLILTFTGISHFSGTNNWAMMKRYIDKAGDTVERLRAIKHTAYRMREALAARDIDRVAAVLREEWEQRKGLAEGVTTPEIDRMVAAAEQAGALASKICGAGGGGCMVTLAGDGKRAAVESALSASGAKLLPFKIHRDGLTVQVLEASRA